MEYFNNNLEPMVYHTGREDSPIITRDDTKDFYLDLLENFPIMIWRTGLDSKLNFANKSWLEFTGRNIDEELDIGWADRIHPQDIRNCRVTYQNAFRKRQSFEMEYRLRRKDGEYRWLFISGKPFYDINREFDGYIGSCYDITEKRMFQKNLEKSNLDLHEAMIKLKETQEQLLQQEKLAEIGHLAAGIAHEINNPLGYIMSNIEIFEKYTTILENFLRAYENLDNTIAQLDRLKYKNILEEIYGYKENYNIDFIMDDFKSLFKDTNDGLSQIKKIVMGLRTFSRSDNQDEIIDCNLNDCIENTLTIANNEIKYYADIQKNFEKIPEIKLSGNNINQVLLNIILNAIQAIKERDDIRRGLIKISTYSDNKFVCCEIEDNGIGIPEENLSKIFNPFFTTKQVGKGTGLGLSISYNIIVNLHGGSLEVRSDPGTSTIFTIKLPLELRKH